MELGEKKRGRHSDNPKNHSYMMRLSAGDINNLIFIQAVEESDEFDGEMLIFSGMDSKMSMIKL